MKRLALLLIFVSIFAQETTHTVKPGDTLWDIAGFYYQNPFLWPYIWRANLTKIEDPHWIYPDEVFVIPPAPEETLGVVPEVPPEAPPEVVPEVYTYAPTPTKKVAEVVSVVKPEERIFSEDLIHRAGFILTEDLPYWGRITGTEPADEKNITAYKTIYIDRAKDVKKGDILTIYRHGKDIKHPKTGAFLGKEIIVLGRAEIDEIGEQGSRCKVIDSYEIIKKGDFVTPYHPQLGPENVTFVPATKQIEGYVVEVKTYKTQTTPPHVFVYIDQGENSGVAVGDIFDVYQERVVGGKKMPDYTIARVQIVSIFERASIGLLRWEEKVPTVKRGEKCRLVMEAR
ncbi:MAG: LysM peptidoglycan-binding domain-containing protein [candidate division WOR-3 bacterium]|nr:LysM peptidoglycan-binding domain-containing protein [candidate division WOR-3 bacterium]